MGKLTGMSGLAQASGVGPGRGEGVDLDTVHGSEEQEYIWTEVVEGNKHIVVDAVAGSGKSFTSLVAGRLWRKNVGSKVGYLCFNKPVQEEMVSKSNGELECLTYHALGLRAIRGVSRNVVVDKHRMYKITDKLREKWDSDARVGVHDLASKAKQHGVRDAEALHGLMDHYGLDVDVEIEDQVVELTQLALTACAQLDGTVDFDDMPWLPYELGLALPKWEFAISDESQDLNAVQQWLVLESAKRLMVVGDPNQAIYGWRGADNDSMGRIGGVLGASGLSVISLPLTYTRRCPKSHVRLASQIVPHLQALPEAIEGSWGTQGALASIPEKGRAGLNDAGKVQVGDLVICRTNPPLVKYAYALLAVGMPAIILGKDISKGILGLVARAERAGAKTVEQVLTAARHETNEEVDRLLALPNGRGALRAATAMDRLECLTEACSGVGSTRELVGKVTELCSGGTEGKVRLGTVHRAKGMEADRVWVLNAPGMPHPRAKREWEVQGERNVMYVALTRSRGELVMLGGMMGVVHA